MYIIIAKSSIIFICYIELIKANKHVLYKTTAQTIGVGAGEVKVPQHPRDGHFSKVSL